MIPEVKIVLFTTFPTSDLIAKALGYAQGHYARIMSRRCMRGPIVFSLLARRLPRTTPAKPCSGSTAMAPPVQPVWQIADEENPVRCRRARGCIRQGHTRQPRSTQTGETPVCSQPCPSLQLHKFGNRFPVRPRPRQAVAAAEAAERDLAVLGGDIDVRAPFAVDEFVKRHIGRLLLHVARKKP